MTTTEQAHKAPGWSPGRPKFRPLALVVAWLVSASALLVAAWIVPGATVNGFLGALAAAVVDRRPERGRAAAPGGASAAADAAHRARADPDRGRPDAARGRPHHRPRPPDRLVLVRARRGLRHRGGDRRARHRPGHERRRHLHDQGDPADRPPLRRSHGHRRSGNRLPGDRRPRAAGPPARHARRQRAEHGALARGGRLPLAEWETDLSSQTGASQAGILLGSNDDIPAFRWVEKETAKLVACSGPPDCAEIERRHATGRDC